MNNITSLAIDLSKNVFQLHGTDMKGKAILKKKVSREKLTKFIIDLKPCNIYMEACGTANYWGRKFKEYEHKVKLINPAYVKPYIKRNKNDANDAAGIAAAARDPDMNFCEVKTEAQQDMQSVHRIRSLLVQQRTATANHIRGLLAEYGITIPRGNSQIRSKLLEILSTNPNDMGGLILGCLIEVHERFTYLDQKIAAYDKKIESLFKNNEECQRLKEIPGVGVLGATMLASILGNGGAFRNGRHFAAFLGLTPKQHSSGNKNLLLGISKRGDTYVRGLLIHGARAVMRYSGKKTDKLSNWVESVKLRRGYNKAAVALANKMARSACSMLKEGSSYKA